MVRGKRHFISVPLVAAILALFFAFGLLTNQLADAFTYSQTEGKRSCVIIDAGHGGVDGGAVSCTGVSESQINLDIALRLNDLLHFLGIHTLMIRTEDVSIYTKGDSISAKKVSDLKERVRIVNSTDNAILVSIHQNYFHDSKYCGAQVFYRNSNFELAVMLQHSFVSTLNPGSKRKAKKATGIYLMDNINCQAALIECGFLSNLQEEQLLRSDTYQKDICCVIGATLSTYLYNASTT